MQFFTRDLLSNWGFQDGDILGTLLVQHGFDLANINENDVLCAIVRNLVIPVIVNRVELKEISTMHNPIRITSVDGIPVDNMRANHPEIHLHPEVVDVPDEVVLSYAANLKWIASR